MIDDQWINDGDLIRMDINKIDREIAELQRRKESLQNLCSHKMESSAYGRVQCRYCFKTIWNE